MAEPKAAPKQSEAPSLEERIADTKSNADLDLRATSRLADQAEKINLGKVDPQPGVATDPHDYVVVVPGQPSEK